jgi:hypothetical protein
MLLEHQGLFNDFSPELRKKLEKTVESFGNSVRYKFDISSINPDPQKSNGPVVWPSKYTLKPKTFTIKDDFEKREGKQKVKQVGLVREVNDKGQPTRFESVVVYEGNQGILHLDLTIPENIQIAMLCELHPKLSGGDYADKTKKQMFSRIDEKKLAVDKRTERSAKLKALTVAQGMSDKELKQFADAMMWDSTDEVDILRNKVEEIAETSPALFNDLVESKNLEYRATVKRAMDNKVVTFDPTEYKFLWVSNQQLITRLQPSTVKNEVEVMAEWLLTGGDSAKEVYTKIKSLLK